MTHDQIKLGAVNGALTITAIYGKKITVRCRCGEVRTYYKSDFSRRKSCGREECSARREFNPRVQQAAEEEKPDAVDPRFWNLALYAKWGNVEAA